MQDICEARAAGEARAAPSEAREALDAAREGAHREQSEETAMEIKRRKLREAQRRYYDKHKRKKDPTNPCPSYCPERIQALKREYYTQHRDEIIARSKKRYQRLKEQKEQKEQKALEAPHGPHGPQGPHAMVVAAAT